MRERPILFSGPMVRAILAGQKTQTRRVAKEFAGREDLDAVLRRFPNQSDCPYGQPGDRLWVRETWVELVHTSPSTGEPLVCEGDKLIEHATSWTDDKGHTRWDYNGKVIAYRATSPVEFCDGDGFSGECADRDDMPHWRPSIHMPRAYCRIVLDVTRVRVERLQAISEVDALAEGIERPENIRDVDVWDGAERALFNNLNQPVTQFRRLWDKINGDGAWAANPWVWVVEFRRVVP